MIASVERLFADLLASTEIRKVDYKRDQYPLDDKNSKSKFIKDIVCIANAPGDDGYIILGVKSEKGKPREIVGISHHYDSSDLETIVNSVIDPPIQFEYYPLNYKGIECALLYIPKSKAKPHWPKGDYGKLGRHIVYTRRSSGNREASIQEIREMCVETMQLSDVAHRKIRVSPHVVDELRDMSLDDRKAAMYKMLKTTIPKIGLVKYRLFSAL
jgi:predicted HTH transcriptional regulator